MPIATHSLLQNLQVRPAAEGRFEVVAGGRRLAALQFLAKQKQIAAVQAPPPPSGYSGQVIRFTWNKPNHEFMIKT